MPIYISLFALEVDSIPISGGIEQMPVTLRTIALKILYIKGFTLILKVINSSELVLAHSNYTPTASHDSKLLLWSWLPLTSIC